jgi:disease resistance protein RPM1
MMILEKCEDLSFCRHISADGHSSINGIIRRLSISTNSNDLLACIENSHVRSLFLFTKISIFSEENIMSKIMTKRRPLKVLDFQDAILLIDYKKLGSLIHLRYLSFKNSTIEQSQCELPKYIGMLQSLETLDLRISSSFRVLPKEIGKLRKLRHLRGYNMSLFQLKSVIGGMELSEVRIDEDGIELIRELGMLIQLRKLGLVGVRREHESALSSSLSKMQHFEKVRIGSKSRFKFDSEFIDLHLISRVDSQASKSC